MTKAYIQQELTKRNIFSPKLLSIFLILGILLCYADSINYQYVSLDDTNLIVDNYPFIKSLKNIPKAFEQSAFDIPNQLSADKTYYRPLLIISLICDAQLLGTDSTMFHITNILLHILTTLLLFYFIRKLGGSSLGAFFLSFLFAVHPLNTQVVCWILGRNDSLLAIFVLLSFIGLQKYYTTSKQRYLSLHMGAFAFALFIKETAIVLLPLYILFIVLWLKDLSFLRRNYLWGLLYALIIGGWFWAMTNVLGQVPVHGNFIYVLFKDLPELLLHVGKILLPFNLSIMPGGIDAKAILFGSFSVAAITFIFYKMHDWKKALFLSLWYLLFLLPTLLLAGDPAYEHRNYIPIMAIAMGLSQTTWFKDFERKINPTNFLLVAFIPLFIFISMERKAVFKNPFVFWTSATKGTSFASLANVNLGQIFEKLDKKPEAMQYYAQALQLDSTTIHANNNYGGMLYELEGKKDEAAYYFMREMKFHPTDLESYNNMGVYYKTKHEPGKALVYFKHVLILDQYHMSAYSQIIKCYIQLGDTTNALLYEQKYNTAMEYYSQRMSRIQ